MKTQEITAFLDQEMARGLEAGDLQEDDNDAEMVDEDDDENYDDLA